MSNRFVAGRLGKNATTTATSAPGIWGMEQATDKKRTSSWIRNVATGGNVDALTPGNGYVYHVFTAPGTFIIPADFPASQNWDVLLVAGGGTGAEFGTPNGAGGGGAGGVVHHEQLNATGSLTITIGAGGGPVGASAKDNGDDSTIVSPTGPWTMTTKGGGAGGYYGTAGNPGGSGGGGGGNGGGYSNVHAVEIQSNQNGAFTPQTGFQQFGNNGGAPSDSNPGNAGGGGGSGAVGGSHPGAEGGPAVCAGGNGHPFPGFAAPVFANAPVPALPNAWRDAVGDNGYYGGGGGGQAPYGSNPTTAGGFGGGGGYRGGNFIKDGVVNTGGGGGGVSSGGSGNGGSGICIIRYQA